MNNRFLYVDVEWNQEGNKLAASDEILEIGAVTTVDEYIVERYFKYIKPTGEVKSQTFNFLGITPTILKHGDNIDSALNFLQGLWNDSDCVVVWSPDSLNIIINSCTQRGISIELSNVVILQNLLVEFECNKGLKSFESTLIRFGALYDRTRMHNAGFDAECLQSLFEIILSKFRKNVLEDGLSLVENIQSKTIHVSSCKYGQRIDEANRIDVPMYKLFLGEKCCKRCMKPKMNKAIKMQDSEEYAVYVDVKKLKGSKVACDQIDALMNFFHLDYKKQYTYLLVTTDYSSWRIYYSDGYVTKLEHQNYRFDNRKGFHIQKHVKRDLFSVLEYIVNHDKNPHKRSTIISDREKLYNRNQKRKKMQKERKRYCVDEMKDWIQ